VAVRWVTDTGSDAVPPNKTAAPHVLDALGLVVPRLPPEDRIVLRRRRRPEHLCGLEPWALTHANGWAAANGGSGRGCAT
jgi:hypothetical protein